MSASWLGSLEAVAKILDFNLYDSKPPVLALAIHLPDQQCVLWEAGGDASTDNAEAAMQKKTNRYANV